MLPDVVSLCFVCIYPDGYFDQFDVTINSWSSLFYVNIGNKPDLSFIIAQQIKSIFRKIIQFVYKHKSWHGYSPWDACLKKKPLATCFFLQNGCYFQDGLKNVL